jgi:hypothetical protein
LLAVLHRAALVLHLLLLKMGLKMPSKKLLRRTKTKRATTHRPTATVRVGAVVL